MRAYRVLSSLVHGLVYPYGRIKAARGDALWRGRLALIEATGPNDIWIHAASVGEVGVIGSLVDSLRRARPSITIHSTVTTRAGYQAAARLGETVSRSFLPIDSPSLVRRSLDLIAPRALVIAETEIWPNLITKAAGRNIPVILVNGRMSEKAFARYRRFDGVLRAVLKRYDRLFLKTESDLARYRHFGVPDSRASVAGDMKFDAPLRDKTPDGVAQIRAAAGISADEYLLVAGSTRPGEEDLLVGACTELRHRFPNLRLLLAPRHLERLEEVLGGIRKQGVTCRLFGWPDGSPADVIVVDRMGILNDLYLAADVAFVGGTLVDLGGHNLLEPVWAQTPVIYGPSLHNVIEAAAYIEKNNLGVRVNSIEELATVVAAMIEGRRSFATKTKEDTLNSPTTVIGKYILEKLADG